MRCSNRSTCLRICQIVRFFSNSFQPGDSYHDQSRRVGAILRCFSHSHKIWSKLGMVFWCYSWRGISHLFTEIHHNCCHGEFQCRIEWNWWPELQTKWYIVRRAKHWHTRSKKLRLRHFWRLEHGLETRTCKLRPRLTWRAQMMKSTDAKSGALI